jgi:methionyl-tRNA formyltransferase
MVIARRLRIALFGTPAFAVPTLDALLASRHAVVGIVTQPDRPRGRGHKVADAPVKARAIAAGLPILQPPRMRDPALVAAFSAWRTDLAVVAAYGRILTRDLLAVPPLGMINVHASLLPRYRGAAPVHRAIIAGERETGVTIMRVVEALDAGPMIAAARRSIQPEDTSEDVERDLARLGAELLVDAVDAIADGRATEQPQDDSLATYAPRLVKEDGVVDWRAAAAHVCNLVRGLYPWPHAFTYHDGRRLILWRARVERLSQGRPGEILAAAGDDLVVRAGDAAVRVLEIQAEGGRPMAAREFLAGHALAAGSTFGTP